MKFQRKYRKLPKDATFAQVMRNSLARRYTTKRYYEEVDGVKMLVVERIDHANGETKIKKYSPSDLKITKKKKGYVSLF